MDEMVNRLVCVNNASGLTYVAEAPPCGPALASPHAGRARLRLCDRRGAADACARGWLTGKQPHPYHK